MRKSLRFVVLFLFSLFLLNASNAQTTLAAGDMAVVRINEDGIDGFSVVMLRSISAGTSIWFTEQGWRGAAGWQTNTEVHFNLVASQAYPAGTVFHFDEETPSILNVRVNNNTTVDYTIAALNFNYAGGDQVIVYQGSQASPVFITGLTSDDGGALSMYGVTNDPFTRWSSESTVVDSYIVGGAESRLPTGLTNGVNAISLFYYDVPAEREIDNSYYSGTLSGTASELRAAINNRANWTSDDVNPYGRSVIGTFSVTAGASPVIASQPGNKTVCSGSNTTFAVTATGATSYQWQYNSGSGFYNLSDVDMYSGTTTNTLTITGATAPMDGTQYRVVVSNASGSVGSNAATLYVSNMTTSGGQTNVLCNGGSNGTATVSASGGIFPYSYSWSPSGGVGATASGLAAGNYTVTVTDNIGCQATRNYTITQPAVAVSGTTVVTNVSCNGGANGTINLTPSGGTPPYTFIWGGGITSEDRTGLVASNYTVTITDNNGCVATVSATVNQPTAVVATAGAQTNVSCNGGASGSATVNVTGGTGTYTYIWAPSGGTGATASGLAAGTYTVTVKDANLCQTTQSFTITQPGASMASTDGQTNVSCNGGANGSATVNVTGGTPGYTYSWAPSGGTAATATGLSAGTYTCTITDANGCTATRTFTITQPAVAVSGTTVVTNVSCNGGANGTINLTPSGGTPPYTFSWGGGITSEDRTGLAAGNYTVTITDNNGCVATVSATVNQPSTLVATAGAQTNVSCNGGSSGSATVNVTGGTGTYTYIWAPSGGTGATASGLAAGTYTVTVKDANLCQTTQSFTITQPAALTATTSQSNVLCNGGSTGSASVTVTGGTPGYTYSWAPSGGTAATATGLAAGTYTCTITDANGCTATRTFTITQPAVAVSGTTVVTNVSCNGGANGTINLTPSGGTPPYTFSWGGGITSEDRTGLAAGNYTVTITDNNGCVATVSATVNQPSTLVATAGAQTNVSCNGGSNGSATVNVTGGTGTYTYIWAPSGGTGATASGLAAGTYTVSVKDANLCQTTQSFTITQPVALTATTSQSNVLCNGGSTGSASVTVSGGTPGYTYSWSPSGGTAATATGLAPGTYTCTITDANGCTATRTFTITEPAALTPLSINVPANGTYTGGDNLGFTIAFSEMVTVNTAGGIPYINLALATGTARANYAGGSGTNSLTFQYAVGANDQDPDGISLGSIFLNGGLIQYGSGCTASDPIAGIPPATGIIIHNPVSQTITFNALTDKTYGDPDFDPAATASSGLAVSYTSSNTGVATIVAGKIHIVGAGSSIITATQTGNSDYLAATAQQTLQVNAKPVTVTADAKSKTYGDADPVLTYTVSPALVSGDVFTGSLSRTAGENVGSYPINQGSLNNNNYSISFVGSVLTIGKASQQITWNQTLEAGCDGNMNIVLTATASSGLPVSYQSGDASIAIINANQLVIAGPGTTTITASQAGDNNYLPALDVQHELTSKLPAHLLVKRWDDVLVFDNSSKQYTAWQWYKNGVAINGATGQYYYESGKLNGNYYAEVKTASGTTLQTCSLSITPGDTFIPITIFPNPVDPGQAITVKTSYTATQLQGATIVVSNIQGVVVQTIQNVTPQTNITMPIVQGIYVIRLKLSNGATASVNALVKPQ